MNNVTDESWFVGGSGGVSSPEMVTCRSDDVSFGAGGIGGSAITAHQQRAPLIASIQAPPGAVSLQYKIHPGKMVGCFLDKEGNEISQFSVSDD